MLLGISFLTGKEIGVAKKYMYMEILNIIMGVDCERSLQRC